MLKSRYCNKCRAADAAATAALGALNDAHGRIVDLEGSLVEVIKMMTDQDDRGELNEHELRLLAQLRKLLLHGTSAQAVGQLRQIVEGART